MSKTILDFPFFSEIFNTEVSILYFALLPQQVFQLEGKIPRGRPTFM